MNNEITLIISELGERIKTNKSSNISKQIETIIKNIGISKHDIFLISQEKNKICLCDSIDKNFVIDQGGSLFLYSKSNKFEIYSKFLNELLKTSQDNSLNYISSSSIISPFQNSKNQNLTVKNKALYNNILTSYEIFKKTNLSLGVNMKLIGKIIDNISYVKQSIEVLKQYIEEQKKTTEQTYFFLDENYKSIYSKINSLSDKFRNFVLYKKSLNSFDEMSLFEKLFNENKIKTLKEKSIKQFNYLSEKIEHKAKAYKLVLAKKVPTDNALWEQNETFDRILKEYNNLNDCYTKYTRQKFIDDLKDAKNLDEKDKIKQLEEEYEEILNNNFFENILSKSDQIFNELKIKYFCELLKKYFDYSGGFFEIINSLVVLNSKFQSYMKLIKNIETDVFEIIMTIQKISEFRHYSNEYNRRITFLQTLKASIQQLKIDIENENEKRNNYNMNSNLPDYIKQFFNWGKIKGNFDIYGDEYYKMIKPVQKKGEISKEQKEEISKINSELCTKEKIIGKLQETIMSKNKCILNFQKDIELIHSLLDNIKQDKSNDQPDLSFEQLWLIKKTFFNYYTSLLDIKNKEIESIKNNQITITEIKVGTRNIFIPHSNGLYICLVLNSAQDTLNFTCEYFLDTNSFDSELSDLLDKNSLIVIGKVEKIEKNEINPAYKVKLSTIDYVLGFKEEESFNKSYIFTTLHNYI